MKYFNFKANATYQIEGTVEAENIEEAKKKIKSDEYDDIYEIELKSIDDIYSCEEDFEEEK